MASNTGTAAVFTGAKQALEIREYPVLAPQPGSAVLALEASGICGTDIHILEGRLPVPPPFIVGHEFIGRVTALGAGVTTDGLGSALAVGDRVIACVALPCGQCFLCKRGETASCLNFGVSNFHDPAQAPHLCGGFADVLHQPARTLVKVPDNLSLDAVAAFPCAGPTAIRAIDFAGGLVGDELVVVQGTGPVGLFAIAWAAKAGCTVIAIGSGSSPERLRLAKQCGAIEVIDYRQSSESERLQLVQAKAAELGRGNGADVVFEASGAPAAIPEGLNLLRTLGTYIVPGQYSASGPVAIQPELITFKALRIIGSGQYKLTDIATYLQFLGKHADIQELFASCISHRFMVKDANEACTAASAGKVVKAVFVPSC